MLYCTSLKKALRILRDIEAQLKLVIVEDHDLKLDKVYWVIQCDYEGNSKDSKNYNLVIETIIESLAREVEVTYLHEGTHSFNLKNESHFKIYISLYTSIFNN